MTHEVSRLAAARGRLVCQLFLEELRRLEPHVPHLDPHTFELRDNHRRASLAVDELLVQLEQHVQRVRRVLCRPLDAPEDPATEENGALDDLRLRHLAHIDRALRACYRAGANLSLRSGEVTHAVCDQFDRLCRELGLEDHNHTVNSLLGQALTCRLSAIHP